MACVDMCVSLLLFAEVEQFGYEAAQLVAVAVDAEAESVAEVEFEVDADEFELEL